MTNHASTHLLLLVACLAWASRPRASRQLPLINRLSLPQVYGLHPAELPPFLRHELQQVLTSAPTVLTAALRSGCTHLTASVLLTAAEAARLEQQPAD